MVRIVKTLVAVAFVVLALAAVQPALGAGGAGTKGKHARIARIAERFEKRCGTSSAGAPQRCVDFANKAVQRLQALDGRVEQRMADHPKLQKLDTFLQKVIGRLHAWLGSTG
ncbi:MAG TPA: hypothetical protein VFW41_09700 [Gaiellaceae bacterium]|nr:hypothetical protein [Gaiellaceae bacterium]